MRWFSFLLPLLMLAACGESRLPSPAESRELVVLTREGPTTYEIDDSGAPAGFEHDLVHLFADEIGVNVRFVVVKHDADIAKRLKKGKGPHGRRMAVAADRPGTAGGAQLLRECQHHRAERKHPAGRNPGRSRRQAGAGRCGITAGNGPAGIAQFPRIQISEHKRISELQLLERIAEQSGDSALVDRAVLDIASITTRSSSTRSRSAAKRQSSGYFPPTPTRCCWTRQKPSSKVAATTVRWHAWSTAILATWSA